MDTQVSGTQEITPSQSSRRIIVRYVFRETMGLVILGLTLFIPAGRLDWIAGWALIGITFLWVCSTAVVILRQNPELLADRLGPKKGAKRWDLAIMSTIGLITFTRCIVAGLDERYGWTTGISPGMQVAAMLIAILGYALVVWATAENAYFSAIVRIQDERGHKVAKGGPYRFVRHPGYAGSLLFEISVPIMLGSWWALLLGLLTASLFFVRTNLEDRTLLEELDGYPEYAQDVRYRLVPGVW